MTIKPDPIRTASTIMIIKMAIVAARSIELETPPELSARVEVSTHNGSIKTDLPITVTGKLSRRRLTGPIGSGEGELYLETHNGSIRIR